MITIENELLEINISTKGAELQKLFHKKHQLDYLWNGDPAFWAKHSPVLFPIVGNLKNNTYFFKNKPYQLSRHGFARDMEFATESKSPDSVTFLLRSDADTLKMYPFSFEFRVSYSLSGDRLKTSYTVTNEGIEAMYFSVGGHPAYKLPLVAGTVYSDYYLRFSAKENLSRWPITAEGLIAEQAIPLLNETDRLNLVKELFQNDALVFKHPASDAISILSAETTHGLTMHFSGFPYLGIWAAKNADFICIEPWCGIADAVTASQQLTEKEGIERLSPHGVFERGWVVELF